MHVYMYYIAIILKRAFQYVVHFRDVEVVCTPQGRSSFLFFACVIRNFSSGSRKLATARHSYTICAMISWGPHAWPQHLYVNCFM